VTGVRGSALLTVSLAITVIILLQVLRVRKNIAYQENLFVSVLIKTPIPNPLVIIIVAPFLDI